MNTLVDQQIAEIYQAGRLDVSDLIAPLIDLANDSSSLIVGYGVPQAGVREEMIPYFHVCGTYTDAEPIRALIVGGWAGTEIVTPFAVARLLAAMENRLSLVSGLEITAYPVANLEAHRQGTFLAGQQCFDSVRCWENSPCSHIRVLENELGRYDYDVVILLRESPGAADVAVEAWLTEPDHRTVVSGALARWAESDPGFSWRTNPVRPVLPRTFTPIASATRQPAEIVVGLPGGKSPSAQADEALGLTLNILHAMREARDEGVL